MKRLIGMFAIAHVGPARAHAHAGARPARHQAAVLGEVRRAVFVRLRAQARCALFPAGRRASTAPRSPASCGTITCPPPRTIYEGVRKLEPGTILTLPWGGEPQHRTLLGRARGCARGPRRSAARRRWRTDRPAGGAAARRGQAPHGGRRAARRVSVGRHRFVDGRRADDGRQCRAGAHLYHRLRAGRL